MNKTTRAPETAQPSTTLENSFELEMCLQQALGVVAFIGCFNQIECDLPDDALADASFAVRTLLHKAVRHARAVDKEMCELRRAAA